MKRNIIVVNDEQALVIPPMCQSDAYALCGTLWRSSVTNRPVMFCQVSSGEYCFISLMTGNRISEPEEWNHLDFSNVTLLGENVDIELTVRK